MKHRGFTLAELLVVLAVVGLLTVLVMPSFTAAQKAARATICRGNLSRIGTVFSAAEQASGQPVSAVGATMIYPDWRSWPYKAQIACNVLELYKCPDDMRPRVDSASLRRRVEYRSSFRGGVAIPLVGEVENNYVLSRRGPNYSEYVFEEAGNITQAFWTPGNHNDGWLRFFDDGLIEIIDCNCGGDNQLWIDGQPAFGTNPNDSKCTQMRLNIGRKVRTNLGDPGLASYGVNIYAHRYAYGADVVVLLDYDALTADPDDAARTREILLQSRRHFGRMNVLWGDGTVRPRGVVALDPIVNRRKWNPSALRPDENGFD